MMAYVKTDGKDGPLQLAYSRDDATRFTADRIGKIREKAYLQWPDYDWKVDEVEGKNQCVLRTEK